MVVKTFSASCFFWITVWRASKEYFNVFGRKSNLKGSPLTSKATNGLVKVFGTGWKETSRRLKKSASTRTIKTSCELLAGAGKFPPVTRRNRRQSVPAEIFACGSVYLRPSQVILHAPVLQCMLACKWYHRLHNISDVIMLPLYSVNGTTVRTLISAVVNLVLLTY